MVQATGSSPSEPSNPRAHVVTIPPASTSPSTPKVLALVANHGNPSPAPVTERQTLVQSIVKSPQGAPGEYSLTFTNSSGNLETVYFQNRDQALNFIDALGEGDARVYTAGGYLFGFRNAAVAYAQAHPTKQAEQTGYLTSPLLPGQKFTTTAALVAALEAKYPNDRVVVTGGRARVKGSTIELVPKGYTVSNGKLVPQYETRAQAGSESAYLNQPYFRELETRSLAIVPVAGIGEAGGLLEALSSVKVAAIVGAGYGASVSVASGSRNPVTILESAGIDAALFGGTAAIAPYIARGLGSIFGRFFPASASEDLGAYRVYMPQFEDVEGEAKGAISDNPVFDIGSVRSESGTFSRLVNTARFLSTEATEPGEEEFGFQGRGFGDQGFGGELTKGAQGEERLGTPSSNPSYRETEVTEGGGSQETILKAVEEQKQDTFSVDETVTRQEESVKTYQTGVYRGVGYDYVLLTLPPGLSLPPGIRSLVASRTRLGVLDSTSTVGRVSPSQSVLNAEVSPPALLTSQFQNLVTKPVVLTDLITTRTSLTDLTTRLTTLSVNDEQTDVVTDVVQERDVAVQTKTIGLLTEVGLPFSASSPLESNYFPQFVERRRRRVRRTRPKYSEYQVRNLLAVNILGAFDIGGLGSLDFRGLL